jgi:uncharacterized protein DUF2865
MAGRSRRILLRALGVGVAGMITLPLATPASAQGFFEALFGSFTRHQPEPTPGANSYAEPERAAPRDPEHLVSPSPRVETGPSVSYCVRTCDGHFFPVHPHAGLSAADMCRAFCPAASTKVYSGGGIDRAVASDGTRYADLDNAFVYRKEIVAGCTCNGHSPFGLAHVDVNTDPTLRPGDVIATRTGLAAFTGRKDKTAEFTPIQSYRGISKDTRDKLADTKIMPPNPGAPQTTPVTLPLPTAAKDRTDDRRRVQLTR